MTLALTPVTFADDDKAGSYREGTGKLVGLGISGKKVSGRTKRMVRK